MSGLIGILHVARTGVMAHQTAVRVVSQNISNAETEGYTRQRAEMASNPSITTPFGQLGSGVRVSNIARLRDPLLDANVRRDSGRAAAADLRSELLSHVEAVIDEPSATGLATALDAFHASWAGLANQPISAPARGLVVQRGEQLASMMRSFSDRLDEAAAYARDRLDTSVSDINRIAGQIAAINVDVVRAEAGGQTAGDLRDQRDLLLDQIAKLGSVRVLERDSGDVAVVLDGATVVDGAAQTDLTVSGVPPVVRMGTRALTHPEGSTLGALVGVVTDDIPDVQQRLDELATGLVAQVNALHSSGYTRAGATGVDFFDPTGTTARSITVTAGPTDVAAADAAGEAGNNRIALALAALRGRPADNDVAAGYAAWTAVQNNLGGLSFAEHYGETVVGFATVMSDAENSSTVYSSLASQAEIRRASVSGVSTDEELIMVMQHQRAYAAAARVITLVDEMIETVIGLAR